MTMICPNSGDIFIQDSERSMLKTHWRLLALIQEIPLIYMGGVWIQRIEIDHNQAMTKDLSPLTTFPSSGRCFSKNFQKPGTKGQRLTFECVVYVLDGVFSF